MIFEIRKKRKIRILEHCLFQVEHKAAVVKIEAKQNLSGCNGT